MKFTEEQLNAILKFIIGITFCLILIVMAGLSMYSVVFVTQPMSGMAPADKNFFLLLSDMSKYILGALATLIAVKGKEAFVPPGISSAADFKDPPPPPAPKAPAPTHAPVRMEPQLDPTPAAPVMTGFGGKAAPPPAPQPEIN